MIADTPGQTTRAGEVQRLIRGVMDAEYGHLLTGNRHDDITLPWMPYQPADFIGIMWDCVAEIDGTVFLDVGCGPGTKMQIAHELFGLTGYGIEIDLEMAEKAKAYGTVYPVDALNFPTIERLYAKADVIWLYRPFRDPAHELMLEQLIMRTMKPGAILAGGSWESEPPREWQTIVDDCMVSPDGSTKIMRGAWQKPRSTE